jgi:hypothetical protein
LGQSFSSKAQARHYYKLSGCTLKFGSHFYTPREYQN